MSYASVLANVIGDDFRANVFSLEEATENSPRRQPCVPAGVGHKLQRRDRLAVVWILTHWVLSPLRGLSCLPV